MCPLLIGLLVGAASAVPTVDSDFSTVGLHAPAEHKAAEPKAEPPKLACGAAEVQSPRDVSVGAPGTRSTRGIPPISAASITQMVHVNTHFHLGAEHKSAGQYDNMPPSNVNTNPTGEEGHELRPGWFCATDALTPQQKARYEFAACEGVEVGNTYEIHSVWSTGGATIADGLGGAFARTNNANVAVQGQVFVVVNDDSPGLASQNLANGWDSQLALADSVKYYGSTTGTSFDNEFCSPYAISWHVDRKCHLVGASSFDKMCADLKALGLKKDLMPHSSRELVKPEFVAPAVEAL